MTARKGVIVKGWSQHDVQYGYVMIRITDCDVVTNEAYMANYGKGFRNRTYHSLKNDTIDVV